MEQEYKPKPIDTTSVTIDPLLTDLMETLARNTHEVWARQREGEGWTFGPARDDKAKRHPNFIPYEQLTEADKDVDRATATEVVKLILALNYRILPPPAPAGKPAAGATAAGAGAAGGAAPAGGSAETGDVPVTKMGLAPLVGLWRQVEEKAVAPGVEGYRNLGQRALDLGEFLLAFDILKAGLAAWPGDVRLRQLHAQALARSGAPDSAVEVLMSLRDEGHADEETLGTLARSYKDQWARATDPAEGRRWLELALAEYEASYRTHGGYWSGINAATLAVCSGETGRARELAAQVRAECERLLKAEGPSYWLLATLGEAALVAGDLTEAGRYYESAWRAADGKFANISSTRRNARLLLGYVDRLPPAAAAPAGDPTAPGPGAPSPGALDPKTLLDRWLPLPCVAVFTGHMIDRPDRPAPRFPPELERAVRERIRAYVEELNATIAYASGACGSDILFLEAMLDRGAEVNVVLPCDVERFVPDSVTFAGGDWEERFRKILAHPHTRLTTVSQKNATTDGLAYEYANLFIFGLAGIRAWQLGAELAPLAVWDGRPGTGRGGTGDTVALWGARGYTAKLIDLSELLRGHAPRKAAAADEAAGAGSADPADAEAAGDEPRGAMQAMLFADLSKFSELSEAEVLLFVRHFMPAVAELADRSAHKPIQKNSWGDGLYFVFASAADAAMFALELHERVADIDWKARGFRWDLRLRTALHVGPVYKWFNPLTKQWDYIGTHVSRAARLEPVTPLGHVYASEVFAAIAFAQGAAGFRCEYVGRLGMAKNYGTFPTYHVRRAARWKKE